MPRSEAEFKRQYEKDKKMSKDKEGQSQAIVDPASDFIPNFQLEIRLVWDDTVVASMLQSHDNPAKVREVYRKLQEALMEGFKVE